MNTKTFTGSLTRSLVKGGAWLVLLMVAFVALANYSANVETNDIYAGPSYAETVAASHTCWTEGDHGYPKGVVVTMRGDVAAHYTENPAVVDLALNHVLGDESPRIFSVTAFCAS
jgi:hypothetical protein